MYFKILLFIVVILLLVGIVQLAEGQVSTFSILTFTALLTFLGGIYFKLSHGIGHLG
jgi:hypothetical protein